MDKTEVYDAMVLMLKLLKKTDSDSFDFILNHPDHSFTQDEKDFMREMI